MNLAMLFTDVPSRCPDTVVGFHCIKCELDIFYDILLEYDVPWAVQEYIYVVRYLL